MKIDGQLLSLMQLFSSVTHADLKVCFNDELSKQMVFVVMPGQMSKAIGKAGANVHRLEALMKTKVKLVEYSENKAEFIANLLSPLKVNHIEESEEGVFVVEPVDHKSRGYIIGRSGAALRNLEKNLRQFFPVKEVKVMG